MKQIQYVIDIKPEYKKKFNKRIEVSIPLPPDIDLKNDIFYLTPRHLQKPIPLIYGQTFWIIHEGHDYKIQNNILISSSDLFSDDKQLLILSGPEINLICPNHHPIDESSHNFCTQCGTKLDKKILLQNIIVK